MFYLTIVNKLLRHCNSWLARQYFAFYIVSIYIYPFRINMGSTSWCYGFLIMIHICYQPGHEAQLLTCLTADPRAVSLILAHLHTFAKINHEILSNAILLPAADSRRVVVSYKRKYVHKVLVNCLVKKCGKVKRPSLNDHSC